MSEFTHRALSLTNDLPLVYTAFSKHLFYFRMFISRYVLEMGKVPLNPFMLFDYFLLDSLERDTVRHANNSLVIRADEIWCFGPISDGVLAEIKIAKAHQKPVAFFDVKNGHIVPVAPSEVQGEQEVEPFLHTLK